MKIPANQGGEVIKPKEEMFCYFFIRLRNSKEAAIKAGFSQIFAESTAAKLLSRADIAQHIDELVAKEKKSKLEQAAIAGLERLAFGSSNDSVSIAFLNVEMLGDLSLEEKLAALDLYNISEFKRPKENTVEIKFFDRFRALEKLLELATASNGSETLRGLYSALENSARQIQDDRQEVLDDDI